MSHRNGRRETPAGVAAPGLVEWLRVGEHERAEEVLADLGRLGVRHLRTGFSWADYLTPQGPRWFDWLIPRLAREVDVLPCFTYTPPSLGREPHTASPPRVPKDYADFLDHVLQRYGEHFSHVELWNEPNNLNDWDYRLDPGWEIFREMITKAAFWCRRLGFRTVLGGMAPTDPAWLRAMAHGGLLEHIDVVGMHGFPGTWESDRDGWQRPLESVREVLGECAPRIRLWLTEGGYSTWRHDEENQVGRLLDMLALPLERCYLYQLHDLHPQRPHQAGLRRREHYHCGLKRADGTPKLAFRLWEEHGLEGLRRVHRRIERTLARHGSRRADRPVAILGGAGFIGSNLARRLCREGRRVRIFDNLSRPGVEWNYLRLVREALGDAAAVFHLGAQVAVTSSLTAPREDFGINVDGTMNVLETLRQTNPVPLLFTSTNKVYGRLDERRFRREGDRYVAIEPEDAVVTEECPLDFHTPYGCSKGAADQYVLDYARSFRLPFTVFRMSCIYGPHQWGTEDQGWVAHFVRSALEGRPITIYGDGAQVRDLLFVEDLVEAMMLALRRIDVSAGEAFNVGGGAAHALSLRGLLRLLEEHFGLVPEVRHAGWRQDDQRYYVSGLGKIGRLLGWSPETEVVDGLARLRDWLSEESFRSPELLVAPRRGLTLAPTGGYS
jgi:CDP-paratose 2-epimerase